MERIGSIGHRHVEISTNFTHFRSHGGFYLQPIRMVVWAVHLLPTIFLSSPAPPATPWPPSPILRHVTPWERIPAGPVETPTTSDNFTSSRGDRGCKHQPLHQTIQSFNLTYTTLRRRHATPITAVGVMDMGHIGLIPLISKEIPPSYPFPQGVREARCEKVCCSTLRVFFNTKLRYPCLAWDGTSLLWMPHEEASAEMACTHFVKVYCLCFVNLLRSNRSPSTRGRVEVPLTQDALPTRRE